MPTPKHPRSDPNILDLRQLMAERQITAKQRRHSWSSTGRGIHRPATPVLNHPHVVPRDWASLRRELLKFGVVLVIVGLISALAVGATELVSTKNSIKRDASEGVIAMQEGLAAIGQSDSTSAAASFASAGASFVTAAEKLSNSVPSFFDRAPGLGSRLATSRILITQAQRLAVIGQRLSAILPADAEPQPAVTIQSDGIIQGSIGVIAPLLEQRAEFVGIVHDSVEVVNTIENINPNDVPGEIRENFATWQRLLRGLVGSGDSLNHITETLIALLAPERPREYLVIFQNNDELRPTGGFPGTYLLIKFEQGTFKILDAPGNGPYALSDTVAKNNLPPQPILSIVPFWTFHDANWYLDVPTSAKTMLDFYAQDRGFTPDGVLFLTPGLMEDLLRVTGSVRPEKYNVDISAENFVAATEQQVELGYDKALNNPKQFLIDLVPIMLTKLSQVSGPDALRAVALTMQRLNQGDILMYSGHEAMQTSVAALGWDGALLPVSGDYLAVVDTNLGGGKTDRKIVEHIKTEVTLDNGVLRHQVAITRTHNGIVGDPYSGFTNRDFIRVYAPPDAQFVSVTDSSVPGEKFFFEPEPTAKISADLVRNEGQTLYDEINGIRVTNESGRKVFGAWSLLDVGQKQTVVFTYTTPAPQNQTWHLDWQHQPGATLRTWEVVFTLPNKKITSTDPSGILSNRNHTATFSTDSLINRSFSVSWK